MAVTQQQVAEVYVATFNRAPDAAGLAYWVNDSFGGNPTIEQIAASFFDQSETQALYPEGTTDEAFVTSIYQNLFNRAPDADGLAYWTGTDGLGGAMTRDVMIEAMKNGATGDDAEIIANKAEVGLYYAEQGLDGTYSLASVTADDATVTTAKAEVDALVPATGETFTLTTDTDALDGTTGDDTFIADSSTFGASDVIADAASNSDNDTLNLTLTASGAAATVSNIENINVTVDTLAGNTADYDATNTFGSTITMNIGDAIDGKATITALGVNTGVAGTGVTNFTVTDAGTTSIDLGSATTADLDAAAATDDLKLTLNGDAKVALGSTTDFDKVELTLTADSALTLLAGSGTGDVTVKGENDLTIKNAELLTTDAIANSGTGTITAIMDASGSVNATGWKANEIQLATDTANGTITLASGNTVTANVVQDQLALTSNNALTKDVITINSGVNLTTDVTVTGFEETTLNATANIVVDDLATGDKTLLTGSASKVTITTTNADEFDASAFAGELAVTTSAAGAKITAGTGKGTFVVADGDVTFVGNTGADTLDLRAVDNDTVVANLSSGNNTVKFDGGEDAAGALTATIAAGAGTDTIWLADGTDLTDNANVWTLTGFDKVEVQNATVSGVDAALAATVLGSMISGDTLEVFTAEAADTVTFTVTTDAASTDLSGITQTNIDSFVIDGRGTANDVIVGTAGKDTITANSGNSGTAAAITVTGGTGADTFTFAALDSGVTAADTFGASVVVSITDFAATASDNDKLNITAAAVEADVLASANVDLSGATTETETGNLYGVITDGILTLSGLSADTSNMDTLAEWVAAAELMFNNTAAGTAAGVLAFEFDGNTYVVEDQDNAGTSEINNVIELAGLTGVDAISATAAANTIVIA